MIKLKKILRKFEKINLKKVVNVIVLITFIVIVLMEFSQIFNNAKIQNYDSIFYNVFNFFTIVLLSIYCIIGQKKIIKNGEQIQMLEEKNKNLLEITDTVRCFKHDFYNIMQAIHGYIDVRDLGALKKYFAGVAGECHHINVVDVLNFQAIENPAIYAILKDKYQKAIDNNITMNIDVFMAMKIFKEKSYKISRILGILLDNALEATKDCQEKVINIRFMKEEKRNRNLIIVENTYSNKNVDLNKIFDKNYTTKKENGNSGLGLWKIRDILSKDTSLELFTTKGEDMFRQQLEIYK